MSPRPTPTRHPPRPPKRLNRGCSIRAILTWSAVGKECGAAPYLTSKGRITIPSDVRRHLSLRTGDRVEFDVVDGTAILRPAPTEHDPFAAYTGALGVLPDDAAVAEWLSDQRDEPEPMRTAIDSHVIVALSSIEPTATRMAALLRSTHAAPTAPGHSPPRTGLVGAAVPEAERELLEGGGAEQLVYYPPNVSRCRYTRLVGPCGMTSNARFPMPARARERTRGRL